MKLLASLALVSTLAYSAPVTIQDGGACTWTFAANVLTCTISGSPPPPPPPPPPPASANLCAAEGFAKTIYYRWGWNDPAALPQLDTANMLDMAGNPGLTANGILVVEFTPTWPANTGTGSVPYPYMAAIQATPYPGNSAISSLTVAVSTSPCDVTPAPPSSGTGLSVNLSYGLGPVPTSGIGTPHPIAASLTPGVTYYINVISRSCKPAAGWVCDARLALYKPPGH